MVENVHRKILTGRHVMKKISSLLLSFCLLATSIPFAYGETPKTAGETLKGYGLIQGYANGSLGEGDQLTRAQMMVLIAQLKGENEQAKQYAIPSLSKDVDPNAWYASYVAYAELKQWTSGIGKNLFGPDKMLTAKEAAAFMVKILGYQITNYDQVVQQALALGIVKEQVNGELSVSRGEVFKYMLNTLLLPRSGSSITLGAELGVIMPNKPVETVAYDVSSVSALSNKLVEVKLKTAVTVADASKFTIKDASGRELLIQKADLLNSKTLWLSTVDQNPGQVYTVFAGGDFKFTGMSKDLQQPKLNKTASGAIDGITLRLEFDKDMDPKALLNTSNYTISNGLTILGAKLGKDAAGKELYTEVYLTTGVMKQGQVYTLVAQKTLVDLSGNTLKTTDDLNTVVFGGLETDQTAPKVSAVYAVNGNKLLVQFEDASELSLETAENITNYQIANKTNVNRTVSVVEAKLVKNAEGKYKNVELKTTSQELASTYELAVQNVTDKFGNAVSRTSNYKATFTGQAPDKSGPQIIVAETLTNTKIRIKFNETIDKASAEVSQNFSVDKGISVLRSELDPESDTNVILTTSSQKESEVYTVKIVNLMDMYGNPILANATTYAVGKGLDQSKPQILSAEASVESGKAYVKVTFNKAVDSKSALIAANYNFGDVLGYGIQVEKIDSASYKVRVNPMAEGTAYRVVVSKVLDLTGNEIDANFNGANFVGRALADSDPSEMTGVVTLDAFTIKILFNRPMTIASTGTKIVNNGTYSNDAADPDNYKVYLSNGTAPLNMGTVSAFADADRMGLTLRFGSKVLEESKLYELRANSNATDDGFDAAATSLYASNGVPLDGSRAKKAFGGSAREIEKPRVTLVYAINKEVVEIRFSTPVKLAAGFTDTVVSIAGTDNSNYTVSAANSSVLSSDPAVLRLKVNGTLASGIYYTLTINDRTKITEMFETEPVDSSSANYYTGKFFGPFNTNDAPVIASALALDPTSIKINFSKEIKLMDLTKFIIATDAADVIANHVEYSDATHQSVTMYFNNANTTPGKVYKVRVGAGAVSDLVGKLNDSGTADIAAISGTRQKAVISDVVALDQNTIRVLLSRPVSDKQNALNGSDFVVTGAPAGTVWKVVGGYQGGAALTNIAGNAIPMNTYVEIVDLKADKVLASGIGYTLSIANTAGIFTSGTYSTKDGAGFDGVPSKSFNGKADLSQLTLTYGFAAQDGTANNQALVTVTESYLNLTDVKTRFAKVGAVAAPSIGSPYNTNTQILDAINGFNVGTATAKGTGTTTMTVTGLSGALGGGAAHDVIVIFYDYQDQFIGYGIVKNVAIVNQ